MQGGRYPAVRIAGDDGPEDVIRAFIWRLTGQPIIRLFHKP